LLQTIDKNSLCISNGNAMRDGQIHNRLCHISCGLGLGLCAPKVAEIAPSY